MELLLVDLQVFFRDPEILPVDFAPDGVRSEQVRRQHIVSEVLFIHDNCFERIIRQVRYVKSLGLVNLNGRYQVVVSGQVDSA